MRNLEGLPEEEKKHFILCHCGRYVDMRDLGEVFDHLHADIPKPDWKYSVKVGEAKAYTRSKDEIDLN
jgi:hypothetical protein